jgi:hypothetical protein
VGCQINMTDIGNIYTKAEPQRKSKKKPTSKIVLTFVHQHKRMDFYYKCRTLRFSPQSESRGEFHKIKVVDSLTYYKKGIYFELMEQRKKQPDVVKNIWVNDGDIFIRRFGAAAPETVKNEAFVDVIFELAQKQPVIDEDEDEDEEESDPTNQPTA